jgi:anti-sigma regulatory factor (Ser/Thr protein kinase)
MPKVCELIIENPSNDNLGASLKILINFLNKANTISEETTIKINMEQLGFGFPLLLLPIATYIKHLSTLNHKIEITSNKKIKNYLNAIYFPYGLSDITGRVLNDYKRRNYMPIIAIPSSNNHEEERNKILSIFSSILSEQLNIKGHLQSALSYIISEAFDNIVEHANISNGWIMAQNYPSKKFFDVCIVDQGIGILKSYLKANITTIKTDEQAIQRAINGYSTKTYDGSRGFGLRTTSKMLVEGLNGIFFLMSGNSFYVWTPKIETIVTDKTFNWKGTIIAARIPNLIPKDFNYIKFIE